MMMYSDDDNDSDNLNIASIMQHAVHNNDGRDIEAYHIGISCSDE